MFIGDNNARNCQCLCTICPYPLSQHRVQHSWVALLMDGSPSFCAGIFRSLRTVILGCDNRKRDLLPLRGTFPVRAEGRGESKICLVRHWGARKWLNLGQSWTIPLLLAGSGHAVLLPQKTKWMQEQNNPDVGSLGSGSLVCEQLDSSKIVGKADTGHRCRQRHHICDSKQRVWTALSSPLWSGHGCGCLCKRSSEIKKTDLWFSAGSVWWIEVFLFFSYTCLTG